MHISVSDCEQVVEGATGTASKYVVYNLHINGVFHCSARYSQLAKLHDALKRKYGAGCLEQFPPKHFFYMKPEDCAERRWGLQKWLQKIGQQPHICNGDVFQSFLLNAQKEVKQGPEKDTQLDVYLANGKKVTVDIVTTDQTEDVLETVCSVLELSPDLTYYFALFLVEDLDGKGIVRRLQDFESPFISLLRAEPHQKIQLRKAYWNIDLDKLLWDDAVALNLMYIETIAKMKNGDIKPREQDAESLGQYRQSRDRRAFLELARQQPGYGDEVLGTCTTSWPQDDTEAVMRLNGDAIIMVETKTGKIHRFPIPRIRCWRTYSVDSGVELEFEFFADTPEGPKMKWIKVFGPFTIHGAMGLQFVVEEKIRLKENKPIKKPSDRAGSFKPRRQTNERPDLSFLTSDSGMPSTPGETTTDEDGTEAPANQPQTFKITVRLSELLAKVKDDEDDEEIQLSHDKRPVDEAFDASLDVGEDEDDDPRSNYASLIGL